MSHNTLIRSGLIFIPSGGFYVCPGPSNPCFCTKKKQIWSVSADGLIIYGKPLALLVPTSACPLGRCHRLSDTLLSHFFSGEKFLLLLHQSLNLLPTGLSFCYKNSYKICFDLKIYLFFDIGNFIYNFILKCCRRFSADQKTLEWRSNPKGKYKK